MPRKTKRNCQLLLYDLNTKDQELTKRCLLKYYCRKLFTNSQDLFKLILMNSKITKNQQNSRYNDQYLGIYETIDTPTSYNNPQLIDEIIDNTGTGECDWLEAVYVAVKSLIDDFKEHEPIITLQLIFLSDFSNLTPTTKGKDLLKQISNELEESRIFLYIIGPNTSQSVIMEDVFCIKKYMEELKITSAIDQTNFDILQELTSLDRTVCCNYQIGLNLVESFKIFNGKQEWKVPLKLGDGVDFPCQTVRVLEEKQPCKITAKREDSKLTTWVDAEDQSLKYGSEDIVSGVECHGKFVPVIDDKRFNHETIREFTIYGFCNARDVPEHYIKGEGSYFVLPYGNNTDKTKMLALIDFLLEKEMAAIARRVYCKNFEAKYVILLPKADKPKCFILSEIPYSHQICGNYSFELPAEKSELFKDTPKNDLIFSFLDSINSNQREVIDKIPLNIDLIQDPNSERIINSAADKLLGKHLRLNELDLDYLNANIVSNSPFIDKLKEIWPEREFYDKTTGDETGEKVEDDFEFDL